MERNLVATLAIVFGFGVAGTVLAATSPFADVPATHWSYDAVNKLAQAGIVDGYGSGTFRGESTLTRYEMATLIANAMTKTEKANAEQKAIIDKLACEYASELEGLTTHVTKLENRVGNVKVGGEVRYRYEWTDNNDGSPDTFTRVRINLFAPLTDKLVFSGRVEGENRIGTKSDINIAHAFIAGKAFGLDTFIAGRIPLYLGQGLINGIGAEGSAHSGADGVVLGVGGNQVKFAIAGGKAGSDEATSLNLRAANLSYDVNKNTNVTASYLKDKDGEFYESYAAGFNYRGIKNIKVTGEYGENDANWAKKYNGNTAKAWYITTKYRGADPTKDNSDGLWVGYRNADIGFDPLTLGNAEASGLQKSFDPTDPSFSPYNAFCMSNVKGFEYGYERTVFKNAIFSLQYNDLEKKDDKTSADSLLVGLTYSF